MMKILFLCNKSPYPPKEGGAIAMNALVEGLARAGHHLRVLAVTSGKFNISMEDIPESYCQKTGLETIWLDLSVNPLGAFLNLFSRDSYHVKRFRSAAFEARLGEILRKETFDIIQLETLYMCPYIPLIRKLSKARIILRAHNIEHLIWREIASGIRNPVKKRYLNYLALKLRNFEMQAIREPDAIAAITEPDAGFLREHAGGVPVETINFGVFPGDYGEISPSALAPARDVFHLGSMNWLPNQEGIRWFLKVAWPELHHLHPSVPLILAGRSMPEWLLNYTANNVHSLGEVDNAWQFMLQHGIMVVPLFSGSGVRIKIVEGMLAARPVISTSKGAQGLAAKDGEHIIIADTRDDFVSAISRCLADPSFAIRLGQNARQLALIKHNNSLAIEKLTGLYSKLLS